ncbi:MAG: helix-turn-helix domain-containing protein [Alphaproteobacteria bacterium]|nr:helix-turn-helix domain-containing protein [Alphaproteobacteria bacterium]
MSAPNSGALPKSSRMYSTEQAADYLGVGKSTLERKRLDGTGPRFCKIGAGTRARVLYPEHELNAWLEKHTFSSTSEYQTPGR